VAAAAVAAAATAVAVVAADAVTNKQWKREKGKRTRSPSTFSFSLSPVALIRGDCEGDRMPLRMRVHDREPIGAALRRFKKLLERSGLKKELRKRNHYEKPCEVRRRAKLRKLSAIRKSKERPIERPRRSEG
jgi:small subunit ribosomal protein S21